MIVDLFVIDGSISPDAAHTGTENTDADSDEVTGIGESSPIVYLLYASQPESGCHNEEEHHAIFSAIVAALQSCEHPAPPGTAEGDWCIGAAGLVDIDLSVPDPFTITWDANERGQIQDGGHDMYDGGNKVTTPLCPHHPAEACRTPPCQAWLQPYTDDFAVTPSDCFGAGGHYAMDLRDSMMILLSTNSAATNLDITIDGNLGADGRGDYSHEDFQSGPLTGFMTSVCGSGAEAVSITMEQCIRNAPYRLTLPCRWLRRGPLHQPPLRDRLGDVPGIRAQPGRQHRCRVGRVPGHRPRRGLRIHPVRLQPGIGLPYP